SLLDIEYNNKICTDWIQLDVDSNKALLEYAVKLDSWPISSKPELAPIWFALLML
ncbi:29251_t:CDS:2, partial [Gigaspora margarita]